MLIQFANCPVCHIAYPGRTNRPIWDHWERVFELNLLDSHMWKMEDDKIAKQNEEVGSSHQDTSPVPTDIGTPNENSTFENIPEPAGYEGVGVFLTKFGELLESVAERKSNSPPVEEKRIATDPGVELPGAELPLTTTDGDEVIHRHGDIQEDIPTSEDTPLASRASEPGADLPVIPTPVNEVTRKRDTESDTEAIPPHLPAVKAPSSVEETCTATPLATTPSEETTKPITTEYRTDGAQSTTPVAQTTSSSVAPETITEVEKGDRPLEEDIQNGRFLLTTAPHRRRGKHPQLKDEQFDNTVYTKNVTGFTTTNPVKWSIAFEKYIKENVSTRCRWRYQQEKSGKYTDAHLLLFYDTTKKIDVRIHYLTGVIMVQGDSYKDWVSNEFPKVKSLFHILNEPEEKIE